MVKIILLIFSLIILFIIAIFSIDINIAVSFSVSTKHEELYDYNIKIFGYSFKKKNNKKKKSKKKNFSIYSLSKYKSHIEIKQISITGNVSLGRADITAIACGIFYSLIGILVGFLNNFANTIDIKKLIVTPIYNSNIYADAHLECILKFNLGDIIVKSIMTRKDWYYVKSD